MRIRFHPNLKKSLEAVLYVLNRAPGIHLYNLLKVMFQSDYVSVNTYGVPVTGDTYLALEYGTVPRMIYKEMIKKEPLFMEALDLDNLPFSMQGYALYPFRPHEHDHLSETDRECLNQGIEAYATLSFEEVKKKNHALQAWLRTWNSCPGEAIDWYDLIENPEIQEELDGVAQYVVV